MPMETEIAALGYQRPRNGSGKRRSCLLVADVAVVPVEATWQTMADSSGRRTPDPAQLTSPRTKSRHEALIVCRSKIRRGPPTAHCNSPECPAVHRVFGIQRRAQCPKCTLQIIQRTKLAKNGI
ncbi:hypothetical protein KR074_006594, partial [Drosophila pseudoananassae]